MHNAGGTADLGFAGGGSCCTTAGALAAEAGTDRGGNPSMPCRLASEEGVGSMCAEEAGCAELLGMSRLPSL